MKKILIVQGHPDSSEQHFGHILQGKYASAAESAKHKVRQIDVAELEFPLLRSKQDYDKGKPNEAIAKAQSDILWADHLVVIFPLWLGDMPAVLKGFFEQVFRQGFAFKELEPGKPYKKILKGKSARVIVTMGMPAAFYRWFYRAHSVKSLERNILAFCGFSPVSATLIGSAYKGNDDKLSGDLSKVAKLGNLGH